MSNEPQQQPINPYATPEANVIQQTGQGGWQHFTRFSAWGYFGLSIITLGIYTVYWFYTRRKEFEQAVPEQVVSANLLNITVLIYLISLVLSFAGAFLTGSTGVAGFNSGDVFMASTVIETIASITAAVLFIFIAFKYRSCLQSLQAGNSDYRVGPVLTFFLQGLYLQYKINELIDSHQVVETELQEEQTVEDLIDSLETERQQKR